MVDSPRSLSGCHTESFGEVRLVQLPAARVGSRDLSLARGPARVDTARRGSWIHRDLSFAVAQRTLDGRAHLASLCVAFLQRFSQQDVVCVDLRIDARNAAREQNRTGGRTLPMDISVRVDRPLEDCARQVHELLIRTSSEAPHSRSRSNVLIDFCAASTGMRLEQSALAEGYDLHWAFSPSTNGFHLGVEYSAEHFDDLELEAMLESFAALARSAEEHPNAPLHALDSLTSQQRSELEAPLDGGSTHAAFVPAHRLFSAICARTPEATAVRFRDGVLRYDELERRSNQLAHALLAAGVSKGSVIAVSLLPGLHVPVAMLAIFKIGAVYCPLDPSHPEAMVRGILDEASPAVVLTQSELQTTRPLGSNVWCLDTDAQRTTDMPVEAPELEVTATDGAYLLYTSGTTGKPKGVLASHGNLAHYLRAARETYGFGPSDVFCSLARYTFSISMFELMSPLCCGGSLLLLSRDDVLAPERLCVALHEVSVVHAGPSLLGNLFRHLRKDSAAPRTFPNVRHVSSGGDVVGPHVLEDMKRVFPRAEVYVIYGCTEISCMGCTYPVSRAREAEKTYVGRPFSDVRVRIEDVHGNQVPRGVVGEICFAGAGLVPGYFGRPDLTAEKFVFRDGVRFYRTGDVGRLSRDGQLEMLGRRDFQVQLRGIRVELLGIENAVRSLGLAGQCAVVLKRLDEFDQRLVAFVVEPKTGDVAELRRELARELPDFMIPQTFVILDAMPLNANGKLDRKRLAELPWQSTHAGTAKAAPNGAIEREIAAAFSRTLGGVEVGIDDDFFDLGGHSLLAVMLLSELENALGLRLSPAALFEHATVRALADRAQRSLNEEARPVLLSQSADKPALFMLLGVHLYRNLARRLEGSHSVYGVYAGRELVLFDSKQGTLTVEDLAQEYVQMIRRTQPSGPYRLGGLSFGGLVAYEVAQQLRAQGEEVAFLGLLDAILPTTGLWSEPARLSRLIGTSPLKAAAVCLRGAWSRVRAAWHGGSMIRGARFGQHTDHLALNKLEIEREKIYDRAAQEYARRMRPFGGHVTLITAGHRFLGEPLLERDCGFGRYAPRLEVHDVQCDHIELVEEPRISEVAEIFRQGLSRPGENRPRQTLTSIPSADVPLSS